MSIHLPVGLAAAAAAALIGAGWQLATRHGVTTSLGPLELAVLRYGIPALVLAPLWWRLGPRLTGVRWPVLAALVAGGGLPFGLLVLAGAQWAPAAHIAVFMAGTMPVFTALAAWRLEGVPIVSTRWLGFAAIVAAVVWLAAGASAQALPGSWRGDALFLLAAMAWAAHTVAFRRSGLTPWEAAAVVNGASALGVAVLVAVWGAPRLLTAPPADVVLQAMGQGVLAGLGGLVAYLAAVTRLGSTGAALSAAAVPPLTAVGAAWLLGEPLGLPTAGAAALAALGVALASGALGAVFRRSAARGRGPA